MNSPHAHIRSLPPEGATAPLGAARRVAVHEYHFEPLRLHVPEPEPPEPLPDEPPGPDEPPEPAREPPPYAPPIGDPPPYPPEVPHSRAQREGRR